MAEPSSSANVADRVFLGLLAFVPLAVVSHFVFSAPVTFVLSALALVPLAKWMGEATEALSARLGAGVGGLLNASFGNAAELIVALTALKAGQTTVVKASITGSILGNMLLVLGAAVFAGGLTRTSQRFNTTGALSSAAMMFLAVTGIVVPDLFHLAHPHVDPGTVRTLSTSISGVLLFLYVLSLWFSLRTHAYLYAAKEGASAERGHGTGPAWSLPKAGGILVAATVCVVGVAELLVQSLEPAIQRFGFTHTFVGVVVIAIIGNAAEHFTAVLMAVRNKMDVAFSIAFESSKQIALFVAPVLVLTSGRLGHPLTLEFSPMEVLGLAVGVGASTLIALDGESNWLEGAMLLGVYVILGVAFFFTP